MHGIKRTIAILAAGGTAVLSAWMLLVAWASSAGVYENARHTAGSGSVWLALLSMVAALSGLALSTSGRPREGLGLTAVALLMQIGVALSGGYTGYL